MNKYICEYCHSAFTKLSNLTKHQRVTKYCLQRQQELTETQEKLSCKHCGKVLSRSDSLIRHYTSCLEYMVYQRELPLQREIELLKERLCEKDAQITDLQGRLWELTNTAVKKTTNAYTHIGQVTINNGVKGVNDEEAVPMLYPAPVTTDDVSELINKLHDQVTGSIQRPFGNSVPSRPKYVQKIPGVLEERSSPNLLEQPLRSPSQIPPL